MKRPNVSAMDEIEAVLRDIKDMEEDIQLLKERLQELPVEMAQQLASEEERIAAARYLYWFVPDIPSSAVAKGFLNTSGHGLKKLVGKATGIITCERCGDNMQFRNRTHLQESIHNWQRGVKRYAEGYTVICDSCWKQIQRIRKEDRERCDTAAKTRTRELRSMPYYEYLQTPEWKARRKQHLQSASYRCQVCNAGNAPLNVHHRTYERRGEERYKDLIVLCQNCHELFHREGRLAD